MKLKATLIIETDFPEVEINKLNMIAEDLDAELIIKKTNEK